MNKFKFSLMFVTLFAAAGLFFTTCDLPLGLGEPVDTIPPTIFIDSPQDNTKMKAISKGNPIVIEGYWMDDIGVTSLEFDIIDVWNGRKTVKPVSTKYTLTKGTASEGFVTGTFRAEIVINADAVTEYRFKVLALDKFGNRGAAEVNVQVDIIPPWIEGVKIQRHPAHPEFGNVFIQDSNDYFAADTGSTSGKRDSLPNLKYYENKGLDLNNSESWRDIKWDDIDEFQNESFRLCAELISTFDNVAASRLNIYRDNGEQLNIDGIPPDGYTRPDVDGYTHLRYPFWDITYTQLVNLLKRYESGPSYISFELRAWSKTDWTGPDMGTTGFPNKDPVTGEEEQGRSQRIGGTMWFPEADNPHVYINKSFFVGDSNAIILAPETTGALDVEFYDDDLLSEIYLGLILKETFDTLRGADSEGDYLNKLSVEANGGMRTAALTACISQNVKTNRYVAIGGNQNRFRTFALNTAQEGEYRLIAFVKETARPNAGYTFRPGETAKWSVYPPLRIQVQSIMAPLIIVESPLRENAFPALGPYGLGPYGRIFSMDGYTLSESRIDKVLIAWAPNGRTVANIDTVLALPAVSVLNMGDVYTDTGTGIKVWNVTIQDAPKEIFGSKEYYKMRFNKPFHIVDDFKVNGITENANKLFVIEALGSGSAKKTYRLSGSTIGPSIDVTSHGLTAYHDRNNDLVLRMKVSEGVDGVAIEENSLKIYDDTGGPLSGVGIVQLVNGEYQAIVPSSYIKANFPEGMQRKYVFEATNILGLTTIQNRNIFMSNAPLIESISCNNGAGSYGIGEELLFEVTYSMPVIVTGSPRLKLYFNNVNAALPETNAISDYANYVIPTGNQASNTLTFRYIVKENNFTPDRLKTSLEPIDLPAGTVLGSFYGSEAVKTLTNHNNSLQTKQKVVLDGVRPTILRASFEQRGTAPTYFKNNDTVTLKLESSKPVMVSGTPTATFATTTTPTRTFTANYNSTNGNTLSFTYTVNDGGNGIDERQLTWAAPFLSLSDTNTITDMLGNAINIATAALPNQNNRQGTANGVYPNEEAYIKTTKPATPALTLHPSLANASTGANAITANKTNGQTLGIRVTGVQTNNTLWYSLKGGSSPQSNLTGGPANWYSNNTANGIDDPNWGTRTAATYTPSSYQITAWQTDRAGNESDRTVIREITVNNRPAELVGTDIGLPDAAYPYNTVIPFKLYFSQTVTANANAQVILYFEGTEAGKTGTANYTAAITTGTASSLLTVNWTVPAGIATMKNIKITDARFTNIVDEYNNPLARYYGAAADNGTQRPIGNSNATYPFQLNRPNLEIRSNRPRLVPQDSGGNLTTPAYPTTTGNTQNGGVMGANIQLRFIEGTNNTPVDLSAVPGKYITIRPYGTWAIPPELSIEDFNTIYNYGYGTNNDLYRRRLSDVDNNGMPKAGSGRGSGYNLYIKNTHGLVSGEGGFVRPDTTTKMVLDFETGLYDGTNAANLRAIFNEAQWKWQKILVTSSYVTISGNLVTFTFPQTLDKGRIWEVLIDEGAFQDAARNQSEAVPAGTYRFWSAETEMPHIRAERVSYDANNFGEAAHENVGLGFVTTAGVPVRPPIDTRVRIDCETPGADIRYNVIRTSYTLNPSANMNTSDAFTSTANTNAVFFNHPGIAGTDTGYTKNNIGNDDVSLAAQKTNGFFNKLLVPNTVNTGTATLNNGTFLYTVLTTLGSGIPFPNGGTNVRDYQTFNPTTGARGINNYTNDDFIYVGELYLLTNNPHGSKIPNVDNHAGLHSGRRDYVVAVALKNSINGNGADARNSGPLLVRSEPGMEGVFKTTLLYRNPQRGNNPVARVLVQGFDIPVIPVVAGFPLRDADSTNSNVQAYNNYFSKSAWRYGATAATGANSLLTVPTVANNNHIWVTWEIVTDWYQKGKGFNAADGNYLNNNNANANSIAASYGSVIYRYQQAFY